MIKLNSETFELRLSRAMEDMRAGHPVHSS